MTLICASAVAEAGPLDQSQPGPARIAIVGATRARGAQWEADPLIASITRWDPHAVVLTGGYVSSGSKAEWRDWRDHWTSLGDRVVGVPDRRARLGDRKLSRWQESRLADHVEGLSGSSWSASTLVSKGVRWRFVVLDTERAALGPGWLDERTWLPKVLNPEGFDHLVVLTGRPLASLEHPGSTGSNAVSELIEQIDSQVPPGRLMAVISGGTATNEVLLHSGSFGEVHAIAGNGRVPGRDLDRVGQSPIPTVADLSLVDGFDEALQRQWTERTGQPVGDRYPADQMPIRGWWKLELDGHEVELAFELETPVGYQEIYRIGYSRAVGWVAGPERSGR